MGKSPSDNLPIILLLSHSGLTRVFLNMAFEDSYHLLEAETSQEILELLKITAVKIAIFDDKADEDLLALCKKIRQDSSLKSLPILIISKNLKRTYMQEFLTAGATDFIREPLEKEELYQRIEAAMKLKTTQTKLDPISKALASTPKISQEKKLLGSRVLVHDQAIKAISAALANKSSISLLMIDLHHLDKVAARWGQEDASILLGQMQLHLKERLRAQDILIPISKERCVAILPITSSTAAKILAEDLEESIKERKFSTEKGTVKLGISIGVVTLSDKEMTSTDAHAYLEKMLKTGEDYLEKAKKIGQQIVSS